MVPNYLPQQFYHLRASVIKDSAFEVNIRELTPIQAARVQAAKEREDKMAEVMERLQRPFVRYHPPLNAPEVSQSTREPELVSAGY